jgi:hypothetical protein
VGFPADRYHDSEGAEVGRGIDDEYTTMARSDGSATWPTRHDERLG